MKQLGKSMTTQQKQHRKKLLINIHKKYQDQVKVPILLTGHKISLNKNNCFVIDPITTMLYFSKVVKAKLQYSGKIGQNQTIYLFTGDKAHLITINGSQIGDIYDKFKSEDGWLDIIVSLDATFGNNYQQKE